VTTRASRPDKAPTRARTRSRRAQTAPAARPAPESPPLCGAAYGERDRAIRGGEPCGECGHPIHQHDTRRLTEQELAELHRATARADLAELEGLADVSEIATEIRAHVPLARVLLLGLASPEVAADESPIAAALLSLNREAVAFSNILAAVAGSPHDGELCHTGDVRIIWEAHARRLAAVAALARREHDARQGREARVAA